MAAGRFTGQFVGQLMFTRGSIGSVCGSIVVHKREYEICPRKVVSDEFIRDSVKFSNQSTTFGQAFNDFSRSKKGKDSSASVVDVEAEVKDAD